MLVEQLHRQEQEVVEVDRVGGFQFGAVATEDRAKKRLFIGRRGPAVVFRLADRSLGDVRIELFVLGRGPGDDLLDHPELVALVVDAEVILVAQAIDPGAQDAQAKRVEGRHRHFLGRVRRDHFAEALAHFARGLVGESDG